MRFLLQKVALLELHFVVLPQPAAQTHTSEERPCPKIPGFGDIKCPFPRGLDLPGLGGWWLRHLGLGILGWPLNVIHVADLVVVPCSCHFSVHSISMQHSEGILLTPLLAVMWSWHFGNNGVGRQLFC